MNVNKKTSVFRTSDGFLLRRHGRACVWSDGDLTFEDYCGIPIDSQGAPLSGDFVEEKANDADSV